MSHFSKIKTRITNKKYLVEALKKMNYEILSKTKCRGYNGNTIDADIVIKIPDIDEEITENGEIRIKLSRIV